MVLLPRLSRLLVPLIHVPPKLPTVEAETTRTPVLVPTRTLTVVPTVHCRALQMGIRVPVLLGVRLVILPRLSRLLVPRIRRATTLTAPAMTLRHVPVAINSRVFLPVLAPVPHAPLQIVVTLSLAMAQVSPTPMLTEMEMVAVVMPQIRRRPQRLMVKLLDLHAIKAERARVHMSLPFTRVGKTGHLQRQPTGTTRMQTGPPLLLITLIINVRQRCQRTARLLIHRGCDSNFSNKFFKINFQTNYKNKLKLKLKLNNYLSIFKMI